MKHILALILSVAFALPAYGQWVITYNITYYLDGGTNHESNPTTYTNESPTIVLNTPTKSGYTFGGWYSNSSFTGNPITSIPIGSTGNKDYWAKWVINKYTITFDASTNGGTVSTVSSTTDNWKLSSLPQPYCYIWNLAEFHV